MTSCPSAAQGSFLEPQDCPHLPAQGQLEAKPPGSFTLAPRGPWVALPPDRLLWARSHWPGSQ